MSEANIFGNEIKWAITWLLIKKKNYFQLIEMELRIAI